MKAAEKRETNRLRKRLLVKSAAWVVVIASAGILGGIFLETGKDESAGATVYLESYQRGGVEAPDLLRSLAGVLAKSDKDHMAFRFLGDETNLVTRFRVATPTDLCSFVVELTPDEMRLDSELMAPEQITEKFVLFSEGGRLSGAEPCPILFVQTGTEIPRLLEYLELSAKAGIRIHTLKERAESGGAE